MRVSPVLPRKRRGERGKTGLVRHNRVEVADKQNAEARGCPRVGGHGSGWARLADPGAAPCPIETCGCPWFCRGNVGVNGADVGASPLRRRSPGRAGLHVVLAVFVARFPSGLAGRFPSGFAGRFPRGIAGHIPSGFLGSISAPPCPPPQAPPRPPPAQPPPAPTGSPSPPAAPPRCTAPRMVAVARGGSGCSNGCPGRTIGGRTRDHLPLLREEHGLTSSGSATSASCPSCTTR